MTRTVESLSVFLEESFKFLPDGPLNNSTSCESRVCITTSSKPCESTHLFAQSLISLIPNSTYHPWKARQSMKEFTTFYSKEGFSHLIVVFENQKKIRYLSIGFLSLGTPIFLTFRISNILLSKKIHNHARATESFPELILNNFESQGGRKLGRMLSSLYPSKPDFLGRQAVTFHNQRDFMFVRRHRYIFNEEGSRVSIQEIGPRFTLKLYYISNSLSFNDCLWSYHSLKKEVKKLNKQSHHSMDNKVRVL